MCPLSSPGRVIQLERVGTRSATLSTSELGLRAAFEGEGGSEGRGEGLFYDPEKTCCDEVGRRAG